MIYKQCSLAFIFLFLIEVVSSASGYRPKSRVINRGIPRSRSRSSRSGQHLGPTRFGRDPYGRGIQSSHDLFIENYHRQNLQEGWYWPEIGNYNNEAFCRWIISKQNVFEQFEENSTIFRKIHMKILNNNEVLIARAENHPPISADALCCTFDLHLRVIGERLRGPSLFPLYVISGLYILKWDSTTKLFTVATQIKEHYELNRPKTENNTDGK